MTDFALGIDVGGTNIRAAIVNRAGQIIARYAMPTPVMSDGQLGLPDDIVEVITQCAQPLLIAYDVIGAGMGCGGQFNPETGLWRGINTGHPAFADYPLKEKLEASLGIAISIDSDVKTAAYGELHAGAGRGFRQLICVGIGTGIGGALIIDGRVFNGATGLAGHLGQMPIGADDDAVIEELAGGASLARIAIQAGVVETGQTTADLFALARSGHNDARDIINRAGRRLGRVLAGLSHTLEPEAILVGGSVGIQPEYLEAINQGMQAHLMVNWQHIRATPMMLGADAGQIGAGLRAFAY